MVTKEKKKKVLLVILVLLRKKTIAESTAIPVTATITPIKSNRISEKKVRKSMCANYVRVKYILNVYVISIPLCWQLLV